MHKSPHIFFFKNFYLCVIGCWLIVFGINSAIAQVVASGTLYVEPTEESDTTDTNVSTSFLNGRVSDVHTKGDGTVFAFPDVCKTPESPDANPVPIPYPVTGAEGALDFNNVNNGDKVTVKMKKDPETSNLPFLPYPVKGEEGLSDVKNGKNQKKILGKKEENNQQSYLYIGSHPGRSQKEIIPDGGKDNDELKRYTWQVNVESKNGDMFLHLEPLTGVKKGEHQQIHVWDKKTDAYLFTININPPDVEPALYPVIGSSGYKLKTGISIKDPYQLIEIKYKQDYTAVKTYLNQIIAGDGSSDIQKGFEGMYYNPDKKAYVFISSQYDKWLYKKPVYANGNILFEGIKKDPGQESAFSAWLFYISKEPDFRVKIKTAEFDTEFGPATLLSERFKRGVKKATRAGDFDILYSGEYFDETKLVYAANGSVERKKAFGIKSYSDYVDIKKGSLIGFSFVYKGRVPRTYKFKVIPPLNGKASTMDITCQPNKPDQFIWQFSKDEEMIEGDWTFEIMDNNQVVYEKKIIVGRNHPVVRKTTMTTPIKQTTKLGTPKTGIVPETASGQGVNLTLTTAQKAILSPYLITGGENVQVTLNNAQFMSLKNVMQDLKSISVSLTVPRRKPAENTEDADAMSATDLQVVITKVDKSGRAVGYVKFGENQVHTKRQD